MPNKIMTADVDAFCVYDDKDRLETNLEWFEEWWHCR